jgi:ketol-acid reductoisomerase
MAYESDLSSRARINQLRGRVVAVLGYGTQGRAHALNLRDSGCSVVVGQRPGGARHQLAVSDGFTPIDIAAAVPTAELLIYALPDETAPAVHADEIGPRLRAGQTIGFLHGFNIHYNRIVPPPDIDVILLAPKGQGRAVRSEYVAGRGVPALVAVAQDASGSALRTALGWAAGIGSHHAGILETTFQHETETDLFGEQAVLCGGLTALIKAGFDTLVEAGYPPELAYFECCHEVKLIADLIYDLGITGMRARISSTARFGDLTRGPRVVSPQVREDMRRILAEVRSGAFAREFIAESSAGQPRTRELTEADRVHPIEQIGQELRDMMWRPPK